MKDHTMTNDDHGRSQASAQMDSVAAMVAALQVDWDRLEELRDDFAEQYGIEWRNVAASSDGALMQELMELEAAAGDCENQDDAQQRINEDALSVEVRSGWQSSGETLEPAEYRIVLCTGGPHVEIRGDLNQHGEPESARLMFQDWGTPLTEYLGENLDQDALVTYASQLITGS